MESQENGAITLNFSDGETVQIGREFWTKNDLDRFDTVKAKKIAGYGIVFFGEYLSEEERAKLPQKQEAEEVKTEFTVKLTSFGSTKLAVVREVKDITNLGLRESMVLVTDLGVIKEGVSSEEANMLKERLEKSGAEVELK